MSRVFLMKWYHFTVEYFEDLRNVNHCEFLIMRKDEANGKYVLDNKLRTWSELRRERALAHKEKPENKKDEVKLVRSKTYVVTRRWGGCPNGCNHGSHYKRRDDIEALRDTDMSGGTNGHAHTHAHGHGHGHGTENGSGNGYVTNGNGTSQPATPVASSATLIGRRPAANKRFQSYNSDDDPNDTRDNDDDHEHDHDHDDDHHHDKHHEHNHVHDDGPQIDVSRAKEEDVSSPDGTPSFISAEDRANPLKSPYLHVGRDFGGTYSGHASLANSDTEFSDDDAARKHRLASIAARVKTGTAVVTNGVQLSKQTALLQKKERDQSRMGRGALANRLGDAHSSSDVGSDADHDGEAEVGDEGIDVDDDLAKAEKEDRSIAGSVY